VGVGNCREKEERKPAAERRMALEMEGDPACSVVVERQTPHLRKKTKKECDFLH
jgi:hypothetical protein